MHGLIFTNFFSFAASDLGVAPIDDERFTSDQAYPDERFVEVLRFTALTAGLESDDILLRFGRYLGGAVFPRIAPGFYAPGRSFVDALLTVEEEIHERVRETMPGAAPPYLRVHALEAFGALVTYTSPRQLCPLLQGVLEGAAPRFGASVTIVETLCMRRGDDGCSFAVEMPSAA